MPAAVQALLLTSGNALGTITPWPVKVLTVGDTTAARAQAAGFADVESAGRDATAMIALASQRLNPADGPVLLACGARQGHKVATSLREAGFRVLRRVTYRAAPISKFPASVGAALQAGQLHAAIFMSAETAAAFVRRCPPHLHPSLRNVLALAIGKPAADALEALPWREVRLASQPTLDGVLALL
jgi:uroporphyrinogen-III synthase